MHNVYSFLGSYCPADVNRMILMAFLFIGLLFIISLVIAIFLNRKTRVAYEILWDKKLSAFYFILKKAYLMIFQ
jgi:hypothetical protein